MPDNPLTDTFLFFTGATNDYLTLGPWRFLLVALYWALLLGSIYLAFRNWQEDPAQRTGTHLGTAIVRIMIGTMWFEGMLWKLPLPLSSGLEYWTQQEATRAAFEFHREFVTGFLLPNLRLFGPFVFLAELMFSVSLILGIRGSLRRGDRHILRAAAMARNLSGGRPRGMAVVIPLPRYIDVPLFPLCGGAQSWLRCLAAAKRAGGPGGTGFHRRDLNRAT